MADPKAREYTVVARRYRPQQFADLVGQEPVAQALRNAITGDRVAHAYLFTGARGVGKTTTARILAKALNCAKGPTPTPCDKCSSCVAIAAGDDIDVREIDGASNRGIDDVRAIRQDVATRPTRGRYKIYIIDEVHMLTRESFNALLKTLEEPPPHVKFIFATTEVQKVPVTILSRCQRFDFGSISSARIAERLREVVTAEKMKADDDALELIARRAGGSMRDAQSLLDQLLAFGGGELTGEAAQRLLGVASVDRVIGLADAILQRDPKLALERLSEVADDGLQLGELLDQLIDYWRDLMLVVCAGPDVSDLTTPSRHRPALVKHAAATTLDTVLAGLDVLVGTKARLKAGSHARTLIQMALIRLARMEDLAPLSQLAFWLSQPGTTSATAPPKATTVRPTAPPEAKKKADLSVDGPATPAALTAESLPTVWPEIIAQLGAILANQVFRAGFPAILGPNALALRFPSEYNEAYEYCRNPNNVALIERAVQTRTGATWAVKVEKLAGPAVASQSVNGHGSNSRMRAQSVALEVPLLRKAVEALGARPVQIDDGFGDVKPQE